MISKIYGEWATEDGVLFVINKDGSCGWYKDKDDRTDFYYTGKKSEIKVGQKALDELGIDKEEQARVEFYKDSSKIYSVKLYFDFLFSEGVDKSDLIEKEDDAHYWFMFKLNEDGTVTGVNLSTFDQLELEKIK